VLFSRGLHGLRGWPEHVRRQLRQFREHSGHPRNPCNPRLNYSSGSSLMIDAPWLLPTQNVTGVVELSTKTRRTFVSRGRRYSTNSPVLGLRRSTRSLNSPPDQASPFLSAIT